MGLTLAEKGVGNLKTCQSIENVQTKTQMEKVLKKLEIGRASCRERV